MESLWSIDQYFEFVLVLMLSTGLSFQVTYIDQFYSQVDQMLWQNGSFTEQLS